MKSSAVLNKNESDEITIVEEHPGVGVIMIPGRGVIVMEVIGIVPTGTGVSSYVQRDTM